MVDNGFAYYESSALPPEELAFTADAECYWSSLNTRAEFGCVLWEPRTAEPPGA